MAVAVPVPGWASAGTVQRRAAPRWWRAHGLPIQGEDGDYLPSALAPGHQPFDGVLLAIEPLTPVVPGQQIESAKSPNR